MSFNRIIAIFGAILFLFAIVVFYIFNARLHTPTTTTPTLLTGKVLVDGHQFTVEFATTSAQQELGLSKRQSLPQDHGMLFVFKNAGYYPFWMKDMLFPLDIIFIQDDKIVSITKNAPPPNKQTTQLPIYQSSSPANSVLEINGGLSDKNGFKTGDTVTITR